MRELVTEALVLKVENSGENNKSVILFTAEVGRLKARAIGAAKTLSKFSPHLEAGGLVEIRLAGNSGWTVTDVLSIQRSWLRIPGVDLEKAVSVLNLLDNLESAAADVDLWAAIQEVTRAEVSPRRFLKILGYSPEHSTCFKCGSAAPEYFYLTDHSFFCSAHAAQIPAEKKIRC